MGDEDDLKVVVLVIWSQKEGRTRGVNTIVVIKRYPFSVNRNGDGRTVYIM